MINSNRMHNNTDILKAALDGSWERTKVISHNIANVDTPGYKRKDVAFEQHLHQALMKNNNLSQEELARIAPRVYTDRSSLSYRLDGNNVDVDSEMTYLAESQLKYNTLISQVNYNFNRLKTAIGR